MNKELLNANLKDVCDGELIMLYREEDELAKNLLFIKYKFIVDVLINKYRAILNNLNVDFQEIYSECFVGFSDGIRNYQEDKEASLPTFITLCVERRIKGIIRKYNRKKYRELGEICSLDMILDGNNTTLLDIISDDSNDPFKNILEDESYNDLINKIEKSLTKNEYDVFILLYKGMSLSEIAKILNKNYKQIDNTSQRVKKKIKDILFKEKQNS